MSNIAIIGVALNFPGARNLKEYWELLETGKESLTHFSEEELIKAGVRPDRLQMPNYIKSKGVIPDVEFFDSEHFGIHADRATLMDPQHRVFMQSCWEAMDNAGLDPTRYEGAIGLFAGSALNTYMLNNLRFAPREMSRQFSSIEYLLMTDKDFLTTQTSFHLGLTGPSVTIQSACSTSLSALHIACQSLLNGECDIALAGAVTIYCPQVKGYLYETNSIVSHDGHVRPFDAAGSGTVYSSGIAVVVLKPLDRALAENDTILAVIKSTAINNDGARKDSFKTPSSDGICDVAIQALVASGVPIESIGMIEANGSGTQFGDPIEVDALAQAYGHLGASRQTIPIGSVKGNIGHMNVASGMGALLKVVASVQNGKVPPSINFSEPNPKIQFDETPFYVAHSPLSWPVAGYPRRAGLNVYGVGGTNGHAIIEQAPKVVRVTTRRNAHLLTLSAGDMPGLNRAINQFNEFASKNNADLGDAAFTLAIGRRPQRFRAFALCHGADLCSVSSRLKWVSATAALKSLDRSCVVFRPISVSWATVWMSLSAINRNFANGLNEVLDAAPDLKHFYIGGGNLQSIEPIRAALAEFATQLALYRALVGAGLGVHSVSGSGTTAIIALVASNVLSVSDAVELLRLTATNSETLDENMLHEFAMKTPLIPLFVPKVGSTAYEFESQRSGALRELICDTHAEWLDNASLIAADMFPLSLGLEQQLVDSDFDAWLLDLLGQTWLHTRENLSLERYYDGDDRHKVSLPTHPFAKRRHWIDIPTDAASSNYDVAL